MTFRDRLEQSRRYIRHRPVESLLVVLATALGVGLVASMVGFISSFNAQTERLVEQPAYREIVVEAVGEESELSEPVVEVTVSFADRAGLSLDDLSAALEQAPSVSYAYLAERFRVTTETPFGRGAMRFVQDTERTPGADANGPANNEGVTIEPDDARSDDVPAPAAESPGDREAIAERLRRLQEEQNAEEVIDELALDSFPGLRVTSEFFPAYGIQAAAGTLITEEDVEEANAVVVLGSELAKVLFPDHDPIGLRIRVGLFVYTVVGVTEPTGLLWAEDGVELDRMAYVPNPDAQARFGGGIITMALQIRGLGGASKTLRFAVATQSNLEAATAQLEAHFASTYGESKVTLAAPVAELRAERERNSRVLAVILFLGSAGLFIACINLFNLMVTRVIKRTKAIGIMRACGATRSAVFRQFLNEALLMSVGGAVVGIAIAPVLARLLSQALTAETTRTNLPAMLLGALAATALSVLFGVLPARQAAKIDAALAVRSE